jgi:hypothetical protein
VHAEYFSEGLNIHRVFLGDINVDEQKIFKGILKQIINVEPIFIRFSGSLLLIQQYTIQVPPKSRIF